MVPHSLLTAMRIRPRSKVIPSSSHASKASNKPLFAPEMKKMAICCSFSAAPKVAVFYQPDDLGKCEQWRQSTPRPFDKLQQIGVCCIEPRRYPSPGGCWTVLTLRLLHRTPKISQSRLFIGRCSRRACRLKPRGCRDSASMPASGPWMSRPHIDARVRPREDVILYAIAPKPFSQYRPLDLEPAPRNRIAHS